MTRAPLFGLFLVAILAAWWWFQADAAPPAAPTMAATAHTEPPEPATAAAGQVTSPERTAVATTARDRPATVRVRVVVAATQQPVAGAEVFHVADKFDEHGTRDVEQRARAQSTPLVTDAAGDTELPLPAGVQELVFCSHDGMWAEATLWRVPEDGAPVLLQLAPDLSLRVMVLGPAGEPVVGAPVTVAGTDRMNRGELLTGGNLEQATAAPDGIAVFTHLQARISTRTALALLDMPLPQRVLQNVDLAALPKEPVILRLPATGSLVLQLTDGQGPYVPESFLLVEVEDRTTGTGEVRKHTYPMRDGRLLLSHMGLGRVLFVKVDCEWCSGQQTIEGPTTAGEQRVVELRVERQPILTGRLVDGARTPLAKEGWNAIYAAGEWTSYKVWFETDAEGRFRMPLPPVFHDDSERLSVLVPADPRRAGTLMARIELPDWLVSEGKDFDLGDVVVAPPPVLVDGFVVDPQGNPVAGARLRVQEHRDGIRETAIDSHATSADDGSFAIRAVLPNTGLHLVAEAPLHRSQDLPITPVVRGLRVVMPATGRIRAPVHLDADVPGRLLLASCTERASAATETMGSHIAVKNGVLTFDDLTPGTVTVALRPVGESEPVWQAVDVVVRGGETTTLPEIDLRGRLHTVALRTVDDDHQPVLDASARIDPDRGGAREAPVTHDGHLVLLLHRPVDVVVHAAGRANVLLPALFADAEVTLHAGLPVVLQLRQDPPAAPYRLEAVLELLGASAAARPATDRQWRDGGDLYEFGDGRELSTATAVVDADGRARLVLPTAGTWRLHWRLWRGESSRELDASPAELRLDVALGTVGVSFAPTALSAAMQQLR